MQLAELTGKTILAAIVVGYVAIYSIRFANSRDLFDLFKIVYFSILLTGVLVRKRANTINTSNKAFIATTVHAVLPLFLVRAEKGLIPDLMSLSLVLFGLLISGLAYIDIWDSFGILPANRGLKCSGLYSIIRHPIYCGYVLAVIGWMLFAICTRNMIVVAVFLLLTHLRIQLEEELLATADSHYSTYRRMVRYRLLPGLY